TIAAVRCFRVSDGLSASCGLGRRHYGRSCRSRLCGRSDPQQLTPSNEQIGETTCNARSMGVLRQPPVPDLGEAEHPLDHPDAMLDLGTYAGLPAVLSPLHLIDHATMAVASVGEVSGAGRMFADHSLLAAIRLISVDPRLLAVQQLAQHVRIVHISSGR